MRFMVMHKVDVKTEAGVPPSQDVVKRMGELIQATIKKGIFLNGAGLHGSAKRARLEFAGGKRTVTPGPYKGKNELIAGFVMVRARTIQDAIGYADRLAKVWGDGEIEVGLVTEPWDIGVAPKPADMPPGRYLLLRKSTAELERGVPAKPAAQKAFEALKKEMTDAGVWLASDELAPSAKGARLRPGVKGEKRWTDGPFAESKELIAGFTMLLLPSKKDALAWADQYAAILSGSEVEVREMTPAP